MREGVESGVFPGGVLLIAHHGKISFHKAFGFAQLLPKKIPLTTDTLFDLASLTKPLATASATALLVGKGVLRLQDPVSKFIPEWKSGDKRAVTLAQLLHHSSGLPHWMPYYKEIARLDEKSPGLLGSDAAKQKVYAMAHQEQLTNRPGEESWYSDIGFILLCEIIERVSGCPLDQFCEREIFSKLKCNKIFFPAFGKKARGSFAATEDCPWRGKVIRGRVHDENAYAMGGVSGHAGLFGTAREVYTLVKCWLASIKGDGLLHPDIAIRFVTRQKGKSVPKGSTWGFGWDTPSAQNSSSGRFFSKSSFGHLGFTGTSIWVDRTRNIVVILLTNRVHPSRENIRIKQFRPALHDVIVAVSEGLR